MSREVLGSGSAPSGDAWRRSAAPVELVEVEPVEQWGEPEPGLVRAGRLADRMARWVGRGRVPAWALVLALLVGAAAGWGAPRWAQQRREAARLSLRLDVAGISGVGESSFQLDTTVTNSGRRPVTVTGARVGPAQLRILRPSSPEPVVPGGHQELMFFADVQSSAGCDRLRDAEGSAIGLPVVLRVTDGGGRARDVIVTGPGAPSVPLADLLCPQPVNTPDAEQVDVSVGKDGRTSVHLVLRLAAAQPVVVLGIDGVVTSRPSLPARIEPNGTLPIDLVLPPPDCPSSGGGFPMSGLNIVSQVVGRQDQGGSYVDLGPAYVAAMVKYLAGCPVANPS
ncbi:MAG TPA: hypothetical protein VFS29_02635 [Motilibacteraceae bacterium]|nr:hypothetical protein [Motilibacteraceae bacterium]